MPYDLVIQNGIVTTSSHMTPADIGIIDGRIGAIAIPYHLTGGAQVIDASGLHVLPGAIDTHVHANEPGRTEWEGFVHVTRALAAGGVTAFCDMPLNSIPPTVNARAWHVKNNLARRESLLDYGLWGGAIPSNLTELPSLHALGAVGFKAFMTDSGVQEFPRLNDRQLFQVMQTIRQLSGGLLALHAEDHEMVQAFTAHVSASGPADVDRYCLSRPPSSEEHAVERVIHYARMTRCRVHIVHASHPNVVQLVHQAQRDGVDISVETCPHYLALDVEQFRQMGPIAKCAPPLRPRDVVDALWEMVRAGFVDWVASDHSPAPLSLKTETNDIMASWGGISGAQTMLPVLLEEGYHRRAIPLTQIVALTASQPAKRLGWYPRKGTIEVGSDGDLVLIDLQAPWQLRADQLHYRHPHSPFLNKTFRGKIYGTIVRGHVVYRQGEFPSLPKEYAPRFLSPTYAVTKSDL